LGSLSYLNNWPLSDQSIPSSELGAWCEVNKRVEQAVQYREFQTALGAQTGMLMDLLETVSPNAQTWYYSTQPDGSTS
jgi:hypothetical protein